MTDNSVVQTIVNSYFTQSGIIVKHHIDSYDDFIDTLLPNILKQYFPLNINFNDPSKNIKKISISVEKINIENPYYCQKDGCRKIMTPMIARLNNHTYSISVYLEISVITYSIQDGVSVESPKKTYKDILLGRFPLVVRSKYCVYSSDILRECKYDLGGYFIINGNEKVLITQERVCSNIIQVYEQKSSGKYSYISEVRSSDESKFSNVRTVTIKLTNKSLKDSRRVIKRVSMRSGR